MSRVTLDQVRATYKRRDAWWTVLLVDPLAARLVQLVAGRSWITPTRLTVVGFLLGLAAAGAFLQATPGWLVAGAALYHAGFVVDCVDGKLARLRGTGSVFGTWLDFLLDRVRVFVCVVALLGGQLLRTDNPVFLLAACVAIFLALFIYLNGAELDKAWAHLAPARLGPANQAPTNQAPANQAPARLAKAHLAPVPEPVGRLRAALHRHRIRLNLVSGVEFEMALLVVAPLAAALWQPAAILWVGGVAGALLIGFELALVARFVLTVRRYDRADRRTPVQVTVPRQREESTAAAERVHPA